MARLLSAPWIVLTLALGLTTACRRTNPAFQANGTGTAGGGSGSSATAAATSTATAGSASAGGSTTGTAECGDGVRQSPEECDGADLGGVTCLGQGFSGGSVACRDDCTLDFGGCTGSGCGDGVIDPGEACDDQDLGGASCGDVGKQAGQPTCTLTCQIDYGGCYTCGDDVAEGPEVCDGDDVGGKTCDSFAQEGYHGPEPVACMPDCKAFDFSDCSLCGNDIKEDDEVCDGQDLDGLACPDVGNYDAGDLACEDDCSAFNISSCTSCGDGAIEGTEACEPGLDPPKTCKDLGFDMAKPAPDGGVACNDDCTFDTSGCCNGLNKPCNTDDNCCMGFVCNANLGACAPSICKVSGALCNFPVECCSEKCNSGACM